MKIKTKETEKVGVKRESLGERAMLGVLEFRAGSETKLARIGLSTRAHWL